MMTIEAARRHCPSAPSRAHGFDHVLRVTVLAERIAKEEGAGLEIVRAATCCPTCRPNAHPHAASATALRSRWYSSFGKAPPPPTGVAKYPLTGGCGLERIVVE